MEEILQPGQRVRSNVTLLAGSVMGLDTDGSVQTISGARYLVRWDDCTNERQVDRSELDLLSTPADGESYQ